MSATPGPIQPPAPAPAPAKSGSLWPWILGGTGVVVILCVVGGLMIAGFALKSLRMRSSGDQVVFSTPAGDIRVKPTLGTSAGLPVYPGARAERPGKGVEMTLPSDKDEQVGLAIGHYHTSDPLEKVDAWYRARLGPEFERDTGSSARGKIRVHGVETDGVAYVSDHNDLVRFVALSKEHGGVEIALGRIGKREAQ